jgi:hemerythrin-like domain-containing protein
MSGGHEHGAGVTPVPGGSGEFLVAIHDHLRHELGTLRHAARLLAAGEVPVEDVRAQVQDSQLRRTYSQFGAFCAMYCRFVHGHHGIEDVHMLPALAEADPSLQPVVDALTADHVRIGGLLRELDVALVEMGPEARTPQEVQPVAEALEALAVALLDHLRVEEQELVPALDRLGLVI